MSRIKKKDLLALWNGALPEGSAPVGTGFEGTRAVEYALRATGEKTVGHRYVGGGGLVSVGYELLCRAFCTVGAEEEEACEGMYDLLSALFDLFPGEGVLGGGMTVRPHRVKDYGNGRVEYACSFTVDCPDFGTKVPRGAPYVEADGVLIPIEGLLGWVMKDAEQACSVTYKDECFERHTRVHGKDEIAFSFERCVGAEGQNRLLALSDRCRMGIGSRLKVCTLTERDGERCALVCPMTVLIEEMDLDGTAPVFRGRMLGAGERYYARLLAGENGLRLGERLKDESD